MTKKGFLLIVALIVLLGGVLLYPTPALGGALDSGPAQGVSLQASPGPAMTYQAEDATRGGGVRVVTTGTGFFGTGYVTFPANGGYIEFRNIYGGSGGSWLLRFRYKLGSTGSNTGRLTVNGTSQDITFRPTGTWTNWASHAVTVRLNSGMSNTIRLASTGQYLANVDQLEVADCNIGPYTNPFASLSMTPTALEVGQTATITISSTGVTYPYYRLYSDNARIAEFKDSYSGITVYNESPIIRFVSGIVPDGWSNARTATLRAVAPGTTNLWVYASGEIWGIFVNQYGCSVSRSRGGAYSNAVPVSISDTP